MHNNIVITFEDNVQIEVVARKLWGRGNRHSAQIELSPAKRKKIETAIKKAYKPGENGSS